MLDAHIALNLFSIALAFVLNVASLTGILILVCVILQVVTNAHIVVHTAVMVNVEAVPIVQKI